jgi:general stress protein YciG
MQSEGKSRRGFASMSMEKRREIARLGGKAAHQKGRAHEFTPDEARAAGRKGGVAVSRNRAHMAEIGRAGGRARGARSPAEVIHFPTQEFEQALSDVAYPVTKETVLERTGEEEILLGDNRGRVFLRDVLKRVPTERFNSFSEVTEQVGRVLNESSHAA